MKRFLFIFIIGLLSCVAEAKTVPLFDLGEDKTSVILHKPDINLQFVEYKQIEERPALCFNWDSSKAWYWEFAFRPNFYDRIVIPQFEEGVIELMVFIPEDCNARTLKIRFVDTDGEILQYSTSILEKEAGWNKIEIPVSLSSKDSWYGGEKANKKMDFPVYVQGFSSEFKSNTGKGWIGLSDVKFRITSGTPAVGLETGKGTPIHVLTPKEVAELKLTVKNQRSQKQSLKIKVRTKDVYKNTLSEQEFKLDFDANETKKIKGLNQPEKYGIYFVETEIMEESGKISENRLSYAFLEPAGPTTDKSKGFIFGICLHSQRYHPEVKEREAMAAAWCGAKVYREDILWSRVEPKAGEWDWSRYDKLMATYDKYGLELQALCLGRPTWIADNFEKTGSPEEWGKFLQNFCHRYKDRIRFLEIWNEPDIVMFRNRPELYVSFLKNSYQKIKEVAPEIQVLTGGFSGMISTDNQRAFVRHVLQGAKSYYDVVAFHGHGSLGAYKTHVRPLLSACKEFDVNATWYANETAEPVNWSSESRQGETLFRKLIYSWANGSIGYNWYDLRNDGIDPNSVEHNYGMLTYDFYPKPVYGAYNTLTSYFTNAKFVRPMNLSESIEGYLFKAENGDYLIPNWSNELNEELILLGNIRGEVSIVDLYGNELKQQSQNGLTIFKTGPEPSFLKLSNQKEEPTELGSFITPKGSFNIASGEERDLVLQLNNQSSENLFLEYRLNLPTGLYSKKPYGSLELSKQNNKTELIGLNSLKSFSSLPDCPEKIDLNFRVKTRFNEILWLGKLSIEVHSTVKLPKDGYAKFPDFTLDKPEQVTRIVPSATMNEHLYWQGPEDLSGQVWLGRKDNNMLLKILVVDDIHSQPYRGAETWKGDNIQVAMHLPGQGALWEIGFTHIDHNNSEVMLWLAPEGYNVKNVANQITLNTKRDESRKLTYYEASIPFDAIGLTEKIGKAGFRFNLLINDNDGQVRESYISIAPGIGETKSSRSYPTVRFE